MTFKVLWLKRIMIIFDIIILCIMIMNVICGNIVSLIYLQNVYSVFIYEGLAYIVSFPGC